MTFILICRNTPDGVSRRVFARIPLNNRRFLARFPLNGTCFLARFPLTRSSVV